MGNIRVNYDDARSSVRRLNSIASEWDNVATNLSRIANETPSFWQGESSDVFLQVLQNGISEISRAKEKLEQSASLLQKIVTEFEKTEGKIQAQIGSAGTSATAGQGGGSGGGRGF